MSNPRDESSEQFSQWQRKLDASFAYVSEKATISPSVGVVLGSGLGSFAEQLGGACALAYADIPHMPQARVSGHAGSLVLGEIEGTRVACLSGRVHAYEGHSIHAVVFGVRLLARLGCKTVVLTNAAGGIRPDLKPGSFMLLEDHLNLSGVSPLVGWSGETATQFVDMTAAYDAELRGMALECASALKLNLASGVYASMMGPSYETPAEIRMLRTMGADAVGMSTVSEVLALRNLDVRVGAISCISNWAAGLSGQPLSHQEVKDTAASVQTQFEALLGKWIGEIGAQLK